MAERARAVVLASTGTGDVIPNATVTVREPGTTTAISETIYVNDDPDTSQYVNGSFQTGATGLVTFYLTNQKRVDVLFTKSGYTSVTIPVDVQKSTLVSGESVATSTIWDAAGDLAKGTGADTAARLARGTANQVLRVNAGATDIEWGVDPAQDKITAAGDLLYGTAADTAARLAIGTAGQVLKVNAGATAPEWGAAAGSSVGDLLDWQFVRKTADESVASSTTFQDDDHLVLAVGASQTWEFEIALALIEANNDADLKITFSMPAGASGRYMTYSLATTATDGVGNASFFYDTDLTGEQALACKYAAFIKGIIINSTTPGNLTFRWAQNTSQVGASQVLTNSYLVARRVA